jgi:fucose permease
MTPIDSAKNATKTIFLICGIGISAWAVMVPFAKDRLGLTDGKLGLLLLLLGAGAITMMPVTGLLIHRFGSRVVMLLSSLTIAFTLPLLLMISSPIVMGIGLFVFGAAIGTVDVAMNAHGVVVQNHYEKPIMSALHGLFSVGGLLGPLALGFLIRSGLEPIIAAAGVSVALLFMVFTQYRFLLTHAYEKQKTTVVESVGRSRSGSKFSWLKKSVLFLGFLCFASFLSEGAMLDWSAVFLKDNRNIDVAFAGIGYASFSVAMAVMRLVGDRLVTHLNPQKIVVYGGVLGAAGLFLAVLTPWPATALIGFVMLGIGAANIVPVFFSEAGRLNDVPSSSAITAVTAFGYTGQLVGPAALGLIAERVSLPFALACTGFLLLMVSLSYRYRSVIHASS